MRKTGNVKCEAKLTTRESNKKIVLRDQYRPADGMG